MAKASAESTTLPPQFQDRHDDARTWAKALAQIPLFAPLSTRQRGKVAEAARIRRFTDGSPLVVAGEAADALYVILEGRVAIQHPGRTPLFVEAGSFIGELALLDGGPRSASVLADGHVTTLVVTARRFRKVLQSEPLIAVAVAKELAHRLRNAHAVS